MYLLTRHQLAKYRVITFGKSQGDWKLEPLGKGLFLSKMEADNSSLERPSRKTLGFYCKSDHPKELVAVYIHDFGSRRDGDQPWPHSIVSSLQLTAGSFRFSIGKGASRVLRRWVTKEGAQAIAVYLERDALFEGLRNAQQINVLIELPRSHGLSAGGDFDARNLYQLIDLVLKNCAY
jgi:hypothetical protein